MFTATIRSVRLEKMRFYGYSAIPVLDREGKYTGTVTGRRFSLEAVGLLRVG